MATHQRFGEYRVAFQEKAADLGLSFTCRQTLSALPAAVGHLIDTLLMMDGLVLENRDDHASGPIGALLKFPFSVLGTIIGFLLQTLLNIPSYVGYYLLDKPLSYFIRDFDNFVVPDARNIRIDHFGDLILIYAREYSRLVNTLFILYVTNTPTEMRGLFGFMCGIIPETGRAFVNFSGGLLTSSIQFSIDQLCHQIRSVYSYLKPKKDNPTQPCANLPNGAKQEAPANKLKGKKVVRQNDNMAEQLAEFTNNNINLFAVLGITLQTYLHYESVDALNKDITKRYKELARILHPDKNPDHAEQIRLLNRTKAILISDPTKGEAYYYAKWARGRFGDNTSEEEFIQAMQRYKNGAAPSAGASGSPRMNPPVNTASAQSGVPPHLITTQRPKRTVVRPIK